MPVRSKTRRGKLAPSRIYLNARARHSAKKGRKRRNENGAEFPCRSSLCVAEKFEDSGNKLLGTFNMRHVPAVVDYLQSRTRYLFVKSLGKIERDEFIFAAPKYECRLFDRSQPIIKNILAA